MGTSKKRELSNICGTLVDEKDGSRHCVALRLVQTSLDFRCYAAAVSRARRMAWISAGVRCLGRVS